MPIIGVEKIYIAKLLTDTASALNYDTPVYFPGVKELGMKPKQNTEKLYAENKLWDQATTFDSCDTSLKQADLASAQRAFVLGQTLASEGGVYAKDTDIAPYVALLYKANLRGGGYRYGVQYKGVFGLPDDSMKGQEGKVEFQVPTLNAIFQPTIYNGMWEYHVDTTDPNCPANIDDTWFTAVKVPGADIVVPTVTAVPADAATGVAATANVVFTFSKAIDVNSMTDANIFLMKADGTLVDAGLSIGTNNTVITIDPTTNLATGSYVAVCTKNVKSGAGIPLAANLVVNFTV